MTGTNGNGHRNREVGARVKALRQERRMTQPVVAKGAGVTTRAYQDWEAGRASIAWTHLEALAVTLGTTEMFLLHGEEQPLDYINAGTQLERIERKLDLIIMSLGGDVAPDSEAQTQGIPSPPAALGLTAPGRSPSPAKPAQVERPPAKRRAAGSSRSRA